MQHTSIAQRRKSLSHENLERNSQFGVRDRWARPAERAQQVVLIVGVEGMVIDLKSRWVLRKIQGDSLRMRHDQK